MKNLLTHFSKIRGLFSASQCSDVGYDCRLTVVRPSFDCRSAWLKLCSVLVFVLMVGVGNVWGTGVDVSFSSWVTSIQNYNKTEWTDNGCTFTYASNNQKNWAYVRCGCKGGSTNDASTSGCSIIKYNSQVNIPVESVILSTTNGITNGSSSSITITGIEVSAYSNSTMTTLVSSKNLGTLSYTSSNCPASITITPTSSWATGLYYKITISWTAVGKKNSGLNISSIKFKEVSCTSLGSINGSF